MAVWQWTLYMIPRSDVVSLFQTVPEVMDEEWFYDIKRYQNCDPTIYEAAFNLILPRGYYAGASPVVKCWGTNNDNEIDMCFEDGNLTDMGVRVNASQVNMSFITSIVDFAFENNLLFWMLENNIFIEPVLDAFLERFRQSGAMLFAQNPEVFFADEKYLDELQKKNLKKLESEDLF
jgi:hypothetical protein